ncbi:hypothetical protein F4779DRAFT_568830 [Xylariaceae sp. FL0662B]|nr:hypothetical protein F4779DRAFT_568830 [Xylariaceae sp. FL0662B]
MPASTASVYAGSTPPKPEHTFSHVPTASNGANERSLADYRITVFGRAPSSTPLGSTRDPEVIIREHRERVSAELKAIERRL